MRGIRSSDGDRQIRRWIGELLFIFFVTSSAIFAQLPTATILGTVKDASGAVVPNATVTARNTDTGQVRTMETEGDGSYRLSALPIGNYEVRVEREGFQSEVRTGLTLTVAQEAVVNLTLQIGSTGQTVSVTAEAPLVNTTSGSLGGLVDSQRMDDLPLNGRNYIDLGLMQMGVSQFKTVANAPGYMGSYFASNGATVRSNSFLLDGAIMTNVEGASSASVSNSTLGVDGIREFRIITNSFSAEYGMTMGSQVVLVSKSGTNSFHGDVFEYLRNSAMDARNFFDHSTPARESRLPEFQRNNFGGSFGGPIKKDKTFFFGVFEGLRANTGITTIDNVMPAACHNLVPQSGGSALIDNQADATACGGTTTVSGVTTPNLIGIGGTGTPSVIPAVIQPILALFPSPNLANNQFTFPFTQPTNENYGQIRVDQNFSAKDSLFGRYTIDDTESAQTETFPQFQTPFRSRNQFATLSENRVFSPVVLNTLRFSLSRTLFGYFDSSAEPNNPQISLMPGWPVAGINIGGITAFGSNGTAPFVKKQNIFTYSDDVFYTRGRHSLKFGTLINHYQQFIGNNAYAKGSVTFPTLTSFMLAKPSVVGNVLTANSFHARSFHYNTFGFYAQDDLRVRSNLTLNLGLRYEFNTVPQEQYGQWAYLQNVLQDAQLIPTPAFYANPSLKNFSPRIGFAWDVRGDGKTAVRGGFGELYDIANLGYLVIQTMLGQPPFDVGFKVVNPAVFTIPLTLPTGSQALAIQTADHHMRQPHILQYNLTVERQLPFNMVMTVAYAGSRGIDLNDTLEADPNTPQVLPGGQLYWPAGAAKLNPNFGSVALYTAAADSWYSALQFGVIKRLTKGLQFQSSYTWSRSIDDMASQIQSENSLGEPYEPADPFNMKLDRGLSPYDLTQVWKLNAIYQLPGLASSTGVAGKILNGWWISGILSLQSGNPFTVALNTNRSRSGSEGGSAGVDRPDLVAGRSIYSITHGVSTANGTAPCPTAGQPLGTPTLWFDPCAFSIPAAGFLGGTGRNILRGPGFNDLDFSLVKDTAIREFGENGKVEFRAEVFNILNRANFSLPSRIAYAASQNVESPLANAGVITTTVGSSRQIQLALKILF